MQAPPPSWGAPQAHSGTAAQDAETHFEPEKFVAALPSVLMQPQPQPQPLIPPLRFTCVSFNVYRGSYPLEGNMRFLQRLSLRTIISVTPEPLNLTPLPEVTYIHIPYAAGGQQKSKKKRGVPITRETVAVALSILNDSAQHPVYLHCLNGSHVTSLVVACYRRAAGWSMPSIMAEFERYSDHDRADVQFIEDGHQC